LDLDRLGPGRQQVQEFGVEVTALVVEHPPKLRGQRQSAGRRERLADLGHTELWGFAIYLASRDAYENSVLPNGRPTGTPEQALDCACGLYLNDPTAWT
jgi:hypothetical protein